MQFLKSVLRSGPVLLAAGLLWTISAVNPPTVLAQTKSAPVNVNTADLATLETLPGVGPATAQKIIDGRPYKNAAELQKASGLSKSKVDAMRDQITFTPASTTKPKSTTSNTGDGSSTKTTENKSGSTNLSATGRDPSGKSASGQKVNINTASAEQLDSLTGIGTVKSEAIVDYRKEHGNFKSIDDIKNVNGIKEGEFEKIKDQIRVK